MIQSIKTDVVVGEEPNKELSFDYSEEDDMVYISLGEKHICTMDYKENFKEVIETIFKKW